MLARLGLPGISGHLGLAVRACFVLVFVLMVAGAVVPAAELQPLNARNVFWLAVPGATNAGSRRFYREAIKLGDVSAVALIDMGGVVIAPLLPYRVLAAGRIGTEKGMKTETGEVCRG